TMRRPFPIKARTLYPSAVLCFNWIIAITIIVERGDLIPQVQKRDAPQRDDKLMHQKNALNGVRDERLIAAFKRLFKPTQRRAGAVDPHVLCGRVIIEGDA